MPPVGPESSVTIGFTLASGDRGQTVTRLHDQQRPGQAGCVQAGFEFSQISADLRSYVRIEDGRYGPFVLAEHRREFM